MASLINLLSRPRSLLLLLLLIPLFTIYLYTSRSHVSRPAVGYTPPTPVLPSYGHEGGANIPWCLPGSVDGYELGGKGVGNSGEEGLGTKQGTEAENEQMQSILHDSVPISGIKSYIQSHLSFLQAGFNPKDDDDYLGLKLYGPIDLKSYTAELLSTYQKFLAVPHIPTPSYLPPLLSRLSLSPPLAPLPPRPKIITTTDAHRDLVPWEFDRWKEIMPEWEVRVMEDKDMEGWMEGVFGGTEGERIWRDLPRIVLKTDVFRYLMLLVEGGIYSDSDTAPIIHADEWGHPYQNRTDPLLTHLSRLLSLANAPYTAPHHQGQGSTDPNDGEEENIPGYEPDLDAQLRGEEKRSSNSNSNRNVKNPHDYSHPSHLQGIDIGPEMRPIVDDGGELGPPSIVVSVESDSIEFGWWNWREVGLSRADQIVQWTIMARPGHPVFLDAIGRSLRKTLEMERLEAEAKAAGEIFLPESALEWTGPGVFTDSIMRYLLVRYGFKPRELLHVKDPIRVGDVLILPAGSYSSVSPFTGEAQRKWAASFHGFFGRWRDADPKIQEQERLKKAKEEEEARLEKLKAEQEAEGRVEVDDAREGEEEGRRDGEGEGDGTLFFTEVEEERIHAGGVGAGAGEAAMMALEEERVEDAEGRRRRR